MTGSTPSPYTTLFRSRKPPGVSAKVICTAWWAWLPVGSPTRPIHRLPPRHRTMRPVLERSEEHTSELQSPCNLVCRLLLEEKNILVDILLRDVLSFRV